MEFKAAYVLLGEQHQHIEGATMLRITVNNLSDITIFQCAGEITFPGADTLRIVVLQQTCIRIAVLDLAEINAIDAAGLGLLVSLRTWARTTGTKLKLMNLTPRVEDLFEITNLRSAFEICSVRDMLDLLCRAFQQSQTLGVEAVTERPARSERDWVPSGARLCTQLHRGASEKIG
jgi:anti-anti-sigma factor